MNKRPILITGAMELELQNLIEKLQNKVLKKENTYEIYEGKINNYPVVILKTEVGTINTAISTTITVQKYNPIIIINQGTSGSHEYNYHKYDLVIGESIVNINSIKTGVKQIGRGMNPFEWQILNFHSDNNEIKIYKSDEKLIEVANRIKDKYKYGNVINNRIGSGDIWNREADRISWFNKNLKTSCEEMEAISICSVAEKFKIPTIFFKIISNNELIGEKFDIKTAEACQEFTYEFVKEYIKELN